MTIDTSRSITIKFANERAAMHFAEWLSNSGEQEYWNNMEIREKEEPDGDITATSFWYHGSDEAYEKHRMKTGDEDGENFFMKDWTIRTKCGRLDKNE